VTGSGAIRRVVPAIVAGIVLLTAPGAWGAIGPTDPGVVIGTGVHPSAVTDRSGVTHVVWATGLTLVSSTQ
jgi:hypothetical protein